MSRVRQPVDGALLMFDKGYKVFPLKANKKTPSNAGWQKWAETADRQKIENFGTANSMNNWGVYCGPSNLAVIDIDEFIVPVQGRGSFQKLLKKVSGTPLTILY